MATELDFLTLPFQAGEHLMRSGGRFDIPRPWAMYRFGARMLASGWWALECDGDRDELELRIRTPTDALIVFRGASLGARVYLRGREPYELALLVSPWPGSVIFRRLVLRRLKFLEVLGLYVSGMCGLIKRGNVVRRIAALVRRFLAGQSLGIQVGNPPQSAHAGTAMAASPNQDVLRYRAERRGQVVALLGETDRLHKRAFELVEQAFNSSPSARAAVGDLCEGGEILPRPQWSAALVRGGVLPDAPIFFRSTAVDAASASQQALGRIIEMYGETAVLRIPLPLALREAPASHNFRPLPVPRLAREPAVSIVLPTKIRMDLLEKCLEGLIERTGYPDLEVIVVDNGSEDPKLPGILARAGERLKLTTIVDPGDFNFPRLVNAGVRASCGEIVLLLNDDIEPLEIGWLHRMVESAMQEDVGAVGARLLYPDGSIQHAGVVMGLGGSCGHVWKFATPAEAERNPYVRFPGRHLAVTGACLAVRRAVFDAVNGFDEQHFPVAFNDIDFCLRLEALGFATIYRGDAILMHHESQSRGADNADVARSRRLSKETLAFTRRWKIQLEDDPYGSPAMDPTSESGSTRLVPAEDHYSAPGVQTPAAQAEVIDNLRP